jgi:hypothetical protein
MSYVLTPYLIDLEKLRKSVGSGDESLIAAVISGNPKPFKADDEETEELSRREALRHLVMGDELDEDSAAQYGFALALVCHHLGEVILPDAWGGVSWRAVEATGLEDVLMRSGPPVALPPMPGLPVIAYLTAEQVVAEAAEIGNAQLEDDDEDLQELLEEFVGWLRKAASKRKDIVFYYG